MLANGFDGGEFSSSTSGTATSFAGDRYASPKALRYAASATAASGAFAGGGGDGPGHATTALPPDRGRKGESTGNGFSARAARPGDGGGVAGAGGGCAASRADRSFACSVARRTLRFSRKLAADASAAAARCSATASCAFNRATSTSASAGGASGAAHARAKGTAGTGHGFGAVTANRFGAGFGCCRATGGRALVAAAGGLGGLALAGSWRLDICDGFGGAAPPNGAADRGRGFGRAGAGAGAGAGRCAAAWRSTSDPPFRRAASTELRYSSGTDGSGGGAATTSRFRWAPGRGGGTEVRVSKAGRSVGRPRASVGDTGGRRADFGREGFGRGGAARTGAVRASERAGAARTAAIAGRCMRAAGAVRGATSAVAGRRVRAAGAFGTSAGRCAAGVAVTAS